VIFLLILCYTTLGYPEHNDDTDARSVKFPAGVVADELPAAVDR
jgi:hypothetical protein